jgi:hypothetical protein
MRAFTIWAMVTGAIFALVGGLAHMSLTRSPTVVLVAVDSSYAMQPAWPLVDPTLRSLGPERYTLYRMATEKGLIDGLSETPQISRMTPYAPRNLTQLPRIAESVQADEFILVTNAPEPELSGLAGWRIVRPATQ